MAKLYRPGAGTARLPSRVKMFGKDKFPVNLVICCKFFSLNDFATVFQKVRVNPVSSFIQTVELESPMLHAKFQDHRTFASGEIF